MLQAWGSSLPHAFAFGFLLPAKVPCFYLPLRLSGHGHGWHSPPLHSSVYSLYHPSINDSFIEAAVWDSSNACSSFWGMQLSSLLLAKSSDLFTHRTTIMLFHTSVLSKQSAEQPQGAFTHSPKSPVQSHLARLLSDARLVKKEERVSFWL